MASHAAWRCARTLLAFHAVPELYATSGPLLRRVWGDVLCERRHNPGLWEFHHHPYNLPGNPNHRYNTRPHMQHRLHIKPARKYVPTARRNRAWYAAMAVAVIVAGLLWRSGLIPLPGWLSNNGGDALWALMVFLGFGFLLPRASTLTVVLLALTFAWGIEFSQLYHAPWIDTVRATIPGKLVLGITFYWPDLIAYAVGIAVGALVEWRWRGSP